MKKLIALLLALVMVFALCACGEGYVGAVDEKEIILMGAYEQDNNFANGTEPIEWIVLNKRDGKALLISKYALDCQLYNTEYEDARWELSSLRTWLNKEFYNLAFTDEEKQKISITSVSPDINPSYDTDAGSETTDKVFLLSILEAESLFNSDEMRMCQATNYAISRGVWANKDGYCWWWLRTPGSNNHAVAGVEMEGDIAYGGGSYGSVGFAVRPGIWINLDE